MSQENVELADRVLAALARRDVSRLVDLSDPEVQWHSFRRGKILRVDGFLSSHKDSASDVVRSIAEREAVGR